jgi:hypothetical protein
VREGLPLFEDPNAPGLRSWIFDLIEARGMAWAVRVLHSAANDGRVQIDGHFFKVSLLRPDNQQEKDDARQMPSGASTLYWAAKLLQASPGTIRIYGDGMAGADIRYERDGGGTAYVEHKDRAYGAAYESTVTDLEQYFWRRAIDAAKNLKPPKDESAARVVVVSSPSSLTVGRAFYERIDQLATDLMIYLAKTGIALPNAFVFHVFGHEIQGDMKADSFGKLVDSHLLLEPAWDLVKPAFIATHVGEKKGPVEQSRS